MDSRSFLRRYLLLRATRWLPTGLMIPVFILFLVERGLSLTEIGVVTAAVGVVVILLELPTGGLADAIGRRKVLLGANVFDVVAIGMLLFGDGLAWFVVAFALEGVYRALESGPLDSWYVDGVHSTEPKADVEWGLSRGGIVIGVALATGSLLSSAIVAIDPLPGLGSLAAPLAVALVLRVFDTVMVYVLMTEVARPQGWHAVKQSIAEVPVIIKSSFGLVATTASLALLVAVEVTWGLSASSWEGLFPVRLEEVLGDATRAAALMGPAAAGAWLASAAGSGMMPWFTRRWGQYRAAAVMKIVQAATLVAIGIIAGPAALVAVYLGCYLVFGAGVPVHSALIHAHATAANRTTVASLNSMAGMGAGALGGIMLGYVADTVSISAGMWLAAAILALGAPLYLAARSASDRNGTPGSGRQLGSVGSPTTRED